MAKAFWKRIRRDGACWVWTGPLNAYGYGACVVDGVHGAHRVAWVDRVGPVAGVLRNRCGVLHCVRPDHWEDVPKRVPVLVERSRKVRELFLAGKSCAAIALELGLSAATVRKYVRLIEIGPPEGDQE